MYITISINSNNLLISTKQKISIPYQMYHSLYQISKIVITVSTRNPLLEWYNHRLSKSVTSMSTVKPQKTNINSES